MTRSDLRFFFFVTMTIQLGSSTPVGNIVENNVAFKNSVRVTRGVEDPVVDDLENYVATIPIESFDGDYFLMQFLDILNGVATFRHFDPSRQEYDVYNTEYIEEKTPTQDIFVLKKYEDRIKVIKQKRTYVILRRYPNDKKLFYVSLIYLKDASGDVGVKTVDIGGQKLEVEWDIWDHRGGNEDKALKFGQVCCKASIFVPCYNNDTTDFQSDWNLHPKEKSDNLNFVAGKIISEDADEDIDFFYDLDDDVQDSKFVGSRIDNLTRSHTKQQQMGRGMLGFFGSLYPMVKKLIPKIVGIGFGMVKSFGGLFGGLGTESASPEKVFTSLNFFNFEVFQERTMDNVLKQFEIAVKMPSSGGLGGFLNKEDGKEKPRTVSDKDFEKEGGDASGRGFLDFLPEDPMPENIVEEVIQMVIMDNIDTFKHPGWKTLGNKLEKGITLSHEKDPFVGFGACNYSMVTEDQVGSGNSAEVLSKILQLATRTHCIKSKGEEFNSLINDGILKLSQQSLQLSDNITYLSDDKLNTETTARLSQAYELAVFSEVYFSELNVPAKDFKAPDESKISHSAYTLGKYVKSSLFSIRKSSFRSHSVKIRRNLVKTLKTFILKLLEDKIIIQGCDSCQSDKEINLNDQIYLTGLSQFIMKGMGPVRKGVDMYNSFHDFFNRNKQVFEAKVISYDS